MSLKERWKFDLQAFDMQYHEKSKKCIMMIKRFLSFLYGIVAKFLYGIVAKFRF